MVEVVIGCSGDIINDVDVLPPNLKEYLKLS